MATKTELECKLLLAEGEIRRNRNNMRAFTLRAELSDTPARKAENIASASYFENQKRHAENVVEHLHDMLADFA